MKPVAVGDLLYRVCVGIPKGNHWSIETRTVTAIKAFDDTTYIEIHIDSPFATRLVGAFDQSAIGLLSFRTAREALYAFDRDRECEEHELCLQLKRVREARCWVTAQLDTIGDVKC